jgi:hypothetical protein
MAFDLEPTKTPAAIGHIVVTLRDLVEYQDRPPTQSASFDIIIVFNDGSTTRRSGNLAPHLLPGEQTALMEFMTTLRARAVAQILGA